MTLRECVGIILSMFVVALVYAFVRAWAAMPKRKRNEGQVILRSDYVMEEKLAHRTNGKANVEIERK